MTPLELRLGMRTGTGLNAREPWQVRHRRVQRERACVAGHLMVRASRRRRDKPHHDPTA